jgi:hypothetical protein
MKAHKLLTISFLSFFLAIAMISCRKDSNSDIVGSSSPALLKVSLAPVTTGDRIILTHGPQPTGGEVESGDHPELPPVIPFKHIYLDIVAVNVNSKGDESGWITLDTKAGVYDLLTFTDTLLASGTLSMNTAIRQIRLVLGTKNSVVDSTGATFDLTIPSGAESGLKINLSKTLAGAVNELQLLFDMQASIKMENGTYMLRPVIKVRDVQ